MEKCTNPFLPVGYHLTDEAGNTIAVLGEDRCFHMWESGSWRAKMEEKKTHQVLGRGMKQLRLARKAAKFL